MKASPAFTSEVLRAARAGRRSAPVALRLAAAFAMAMCVLAVVQIAVMQHDRRQEMAALRAERQQLQADLDAVKRIAREAEPVIVLENDRGGRVIVDLDSAVQPVALRNYD